MIGAAVVFLLIACVVATAGNAPPRVSEQQIAMLERHGRALGATDHAPSRTPGGRNIGSNLCGRSQVSFELGRLLRLPAAYLRRIQYTYIRDCSD
jgi:hypothetical protein